MMYEHGQDPLLDAVAENDGLRMQELLAYPDIYICPSSVSLYCYINQAYWSETDPPILTMLVKRVPLSKFLDCEEMFFRKKEGAKWEYLRPTYNMWVDWLSAKHAEAVTLLLMHRRRRGLFAEVPKDLILLICDYLLSRYQMPEPCDHRL